MIKMNDDKNDEVTFLLRLKPTPPLRRKRYTTDIKPNVSVHSTTPKGWDVIIEQKEIDDKKPPLSPLLRTRRLSHQLHQDYQNDSCHRITTETRNFDRNEETNIKRPPEIKPRTSSLENSHRKINLLKDIFSSPKFPRRRNSFDNNRFSQLTLSCFGDKSPNNDEQFDDKLYERKTKSPSPPPLPPRFRPSAPPQELVDSILWHPKPYFPIYHPYYTPPNFMPFNTFANLMQQSPDIFKENVNLHAPTTMTTIATVQNFNTTTTAQRNNRNSGTDLISGASIQQEHHPVSGNITGFHYTSNNNTLTSPTFIQPPKPLPRHSLINKTANLNESNGIINSHRDVTHHLLLVSISNYSNYINRVFFSFSFCSN